jgi:CubicO group peptidase (beta-lactamase class C family)
LSDPVEKYFPEVRKINGRPADAPPITLVQLATMTSGLAREPDRLETYLKGPVSQWENVLIDALAETHYRFEPDTQYHYSNIGYAILGAALGRANDLGYVDHVRERIFKPLGMLHTSFEATPELQKSIAKGYALRDGKPDGEIPQREHAGRGYKVPNGAMYTTVGDLARFLSFQLGFGPHGVLSPTRLEANFRQVHSSDDRLSSGYGIGFSISRDEELVAIGHGGSVAGYNAAAYVDRVSNTGVIVLRNVGRGRFSASGLCREALGVVADAHRADRTALIATSR